MNNSISNSMRHYCGVYHSQISAYEGEIEGHFVAYKLKHPEWSVSNVRIPWLHPYNYTPMPVSEAYYMNKLIHEFCREDTEKVRRLQLILDTKNKKHFSNLDKELNSQFCEFLKNHPSINWIKVY